MNILIFDEKYEKYDALILVDSIESIMKHISVLEDFISQYEKTDGCIVVDQIFSMGNFENRYLEFRFLDNKIIASSFSILKVNKFSELRKWSGDLINSSKRLSKNTALTSFEYRLVKRGIVI